MIIPPALAVGVSPSRVVLKYEPNFVYEREICHTVESMPLLNITVDGEFAEYVELLNIKGSVLNVPEVGCLKYRFTMPPSIEKPGMHHTYIRATEIPDEGSGGLFRVTVTITHQIYVFVPYPGKYIEINSFLAYNVPAGDEVPFQAEIVNKGTETVGQASGMIKIYDRSNKLIGTVRTNTIQGLEPDQVKYLTARWDSGDFKADNYRAELEVTYDSGVSNASAPFKLGGLDINLMDYTKELTVGGEYKGFFVVADSIWSQSIEKVRAIVDVYQNSSSPEPITSVETVSRDIPAWGTEKLTGFIEMRNLEIGKYFLRIKLFFKDPDVADKDKQKDYEGELSIVASPPPPKPARQSFSEKLRGIFTTQVLMIAFVGLILVVLAMLIYLLIPRRKKKDKDEGAKDKKDKNPKQQP